MTSLRSTALALPFPFLSLAIACGGSTDVSEPTPAGASATSSSSSSSSGSATTADASSGACQVTASTTATSTVDASGCAILARDTSGCRDARIALGLSGPWLALSCRVTLSVSGGIVTAQSDGLPDYTSFYFEDANACYAPYPSGKRNPNRIATKDLRISFPLSPSGAGQTMHGAAVVGIALNGVPIYGNFAAPGDDIFNEALTFDRCAGHPQMQGMYHYHSEPTSITQNDGNLVGMMRDGYAVYGRKDQDGTMPALDDAGGHVGITPDSPSAPVYHYHVNEQTSTGTRTAGQKQWFLTTGKFHSAPAACGGC